jgi:hypothetical protein
VRLSSGSSTPGQFQSLYNSSSNGKIGTNPSIYKTLPYDTVKDFTPLIFAGQT